MNKLVLLTPLLIVLSFFLLSRPVNKSPELILNNAYFKINTLNNYSLNSTIVMDVNLMNASMRYVSNVTRAFLNGNKYIKIVTASPFSSKLSIVEQLTINGINYVCSDEFNKGVCYINNDSLIIQDVKSDKSFNSTIYAGSKRVNGLSCDVISTKPNITEIRSVLNSTIDSDSLSSINDFFMYSCINPDTGLTLESLWGVSGESSYNGLLVDMGINVTNFVNSITYGVSESLFKIPYEVISFDEYLELINESYSNLSKSLY